MDSTFRYSISNFKNILIVVSFLLYFLALYQLNQIISSASGALAAIPIAIFAWYYGKRAGAIGALAVIVFNLGMLLRLFSKSFDQVLLLNTLLGSLVLLFVGFIVGYVSDLRRQLLHLLAERSQHEETLRRQEEILRNFLSQSNDGIYLADENHRIIEWNPSMKEITGIGRADALGKHVAEITWLLMPKAIRTPQFLEDIKNRFILDEDGNLDWLDKPVEIAVAAENDRPARIIQQMAFQIRVTENTFFGGIYRDITSLKNMEKMLTESEEKYHSIIQQVPIGVFRSTFEGRIVHANPALLDLLGYETRDLEKFEDVRIAYADPEDRNCLLDALRAHPEGAHMELLLRKSDSTPVWVEVSAQAVYDQQKKSGYIDGTVHDVNTRRKAEDRLNFQSTHDSLTRLNNRTYFDNAIKKLSQKEHFPISIIMVDVDNMKEINDRFGHNQGYEHLKRCAVLLKNSFRADDIVARIG